VATGFTDEMLTELTSQLKSLVTSDPPRDLQFKAKNVDVWLEPKFVWELRCADLGASPTYCAAINKIAQVAGKGISMRFPRFVRARVDKSVKMATTSSMLLVAFQEGIK
jgi:DNA ligase-1